MNDLRNRSSISVRVSRSRGEKDPRVFRNGRRQMQDLGTRLGEGLNVNKDGKLSVNKIVNLDPADPEFADKLVTALIVAGLMEK